MVSSPKGWKKAALPGLAYPKEERFQGCKPVLGGIPCSAWVQGSPVSSSKEHPCPLGRVPTKFSETHTFSLSFCLSLPLSSVSALSASPPLPGYWELKEAGFTASVPINSGIQPFSQNKTSTNTNSPQISPTLTDCSLL